MPWSSQKHQFEEIKDNYDNVKESMKRIYNSYLKPLEDHYDFASFHSKPLQDADFAAKPMVLLVGQYSVGKTSFIKYLLQKDFPGMRIGPEPTTDSFIAVMQGDKDRETGLILEGKVPGEALVLDQTKPFKSLNDFGNSFLTRFHSSNLDHELLKSVSFIDTPGILSGTKQRLNRGYRYSKVLQWFAERVDMIILLFDAHKLDISDEFQEAIMACKRYESKIRVVLNKADQINNEQLMKVYGALMWSMGKILSTPEVIRVYIGSFWEQPLRHDEMRSFFERERNALFQDISSLPKQSAIRKLNDMIKRAKLAKVHACIISYLRKQLPLLARGRAKESMIERLGEIFQRVAAKHKISISDFPNLNDMKENLREADFSKFKKLNGDLLIRVDDMIDEDIGQLLGAIKRDDSKAVETAGTASGVMMKGGVFNNVSYNRTATTSSNPFFERYGEGIMLGADYGASAENSFDWIVNEKKSEYDAVFKTLNPSESGKVYGTKAKKVFVKSKLPNTELAKIWRLADHDHDGRLCDEEFALMMHLIDIRSQGHELPDKLPKHLVPPSQRVFRVNQLIKSKISSVSIRTTSQNIVNKTQSESYMEVSQEQKMHQTDE